MKPDYYLIINKENGKRQRYADGSVVECLRSADACLDVIKNKFGNSPYLTIKRVSSNLYKPIESFI